MFLFRQYILLLPLSAIISLCLTSCGETKFAQCEKILTVVNQVADQTKPLVNTDKPVDKIIWLQAADTMEQAANNMNSLPIADTKLQEYQTGFTKMYRDYSQATRDIIKAREDRDRLAAEAAIQKVKQAGQLEQEIGTGINQYCQKK
jgi:hypothetical protein